MASTARPARHQISRSFGALHSPEPRQLNVFPEYNSLVKLRGPVKRNPLRGFCKTNDHIHCDVFAVSSLHQEPSYTVCGTDQYRFSGYILYITLKQVEFVIRSPIKMNISILVRLLCDAGSPLRARIAGRQKFSSAGQTIAATTNSPQSIYLPDQMSSALTGVHCANLFRGFMHMNRAKA